MLTKDTLRFINRGITRSLSGQRAVVNRETGQTPRYRIRIPSDKLDLLVGITLEDRYYVLSLLGKGGMSLVYKAKDLETGEVVAVKCLRTQVLGDENVVLRFKREADVLDRLNHPRIVQFYGYGTNKRGQPYFVMDYLVGTSLGEILRKQGRLDLGRFQDIFVQVAAAIGHAHKHGAVHRDIKPGNIMLVEKGGTSDYVKIVDFGIAKVTEGTQKLTRLGEVWGSPIYMSPEQCVGSDIDARTDIYSLGIVMYEALTGEVPFLGRNYADTMMKQMSEEPPSFAKVNPKVSIPEELEKIVFRAIRKKPDERYQTMGELKHDLEWALNKSLGIMPKQPAPMLNISGRQMTQEEPIPEYQENARNNIRVTSEKLERVKPGKTPEDLQQRITSEDMPKFDPNEKLSRNSLKKVIAPSSDARALNKEKPDGQRNEEDSEALNFEPPQDRLKFELTGPQIISASTTGDTTKKKENPRKSNPRISDQTTGENPRVSRQRMQTRPQETSRRKDESGDSARKSTSGVRARRKTSSRNRLTAQLPVEKKDSAESDSRFKQIFMTILIFALVLGVGFACRDYFATLAKEVLYFPSEEQQSALDPDQANTAEDEKSGLKPTSKTEPFDGL